MERRTWKKVVSVVVALCLVFSVIPQGMAVAETAPVAEGNRYDMPVSTESKAFVAPANMDIKALQVAPKEEAQEEKPVDVAPVTNQDQQVNPKALGNNQPPEVVVNPKALGNNQPPEVVACPPTPPVPEGAKPVDPEHKQGYQDIFGQAPDKMFEETKNGVTTITFYGADGKVIGTITKTPGSNGKEQPGVFKKADGTKIDLLEQFGKTRGTAYQAYLLKALDPVTAAALLDEWIKNPGEGKFTDAVCFLDDTILTAAEVGKMLAKMKAENSAKILAALDSRNMPDRLNMNDVRKAMMAASGIPAYPGANGTAEQWNAYTKALVDFMKGTTDTGLHQMAWDLINTSLKDPKSAGKIGWQSIQSIMSAMTGEFKKLYSDPSYKLDLDAIKGTVVDAALAIAGSDAFKSLTDANKIAFTQAFTGLGVELTWRKPPADKAEAYKALYTKIGDYYKSLMGSGNSSAVTAYSFQALMGLWRKGNWGSPEGNKEGVAAVLKQAMTVDGGLDKLIASWKTGLADGSKLNGEQQGWLATALGQVIWQNGALKTAGMTITDAQMQDYAQLISGYLGKVDKGDVAITANMKNHLINVVGSALIVSMYFKDGANFKTVKAYQDMGAAYLDLGNNLLTLSKENGGGVAYQTSVINVTTSVWHHAKATGNTETVTACQDLLFNKNFNADTYLKNATADMGNATKPADYKAWTATGMNNLEKMRLEFNKEVAAKKIKDSIASIKDWITAKNSLDNMREMDWQADVYKSLGSLLTAMKNAKSSALENAELQANVVAIFKTLVKGTAGTSVKDSLVQQMGKGALDSFIKSLGTDTKWAKLRTDLEAVSKQIK